MAGDTMKREQVEFMKSQGKKILDLLIEISPVPQGVKDAYSVSQEVETALSLTGTASAGQLEGTDENVNRLALIARRLSNELSSLNRRDEQWWIDTSGANLFSPAQSTEALMLLQRRRQTLIALKEACDGMRSLALALGVYGFSNVKALPKAMTSLVVLDIEVIKETRKNFDICIRHIDSILQKVEFAIRVTADMTKPLDRFLTLVNTQDQRTTLKAIQEAGPASAPAPPAR